MSETNTEVVVGLSKEEIQQLDDMIDQAYGLRYSNPTQTVEKANQAFELSSLGNYSKGVAAASRVMGIGNVILCNFDTALNDLQLAQSIFTDINNQEGITQVTANLGVVYQRMEQYDFALECHIKAIALANETNNQIVKGHCLINMATIYFKLKQFQNTEKFTRESMEIFRELRDFHAWSTALTTLGNLYEEQDNPEKAKVYYDEALKYARQDGSLTAISKVLQLLGRLYMTKGANDKALEYFLETIKLLEELGDKHALAEVYVDLCLLHIRKGSHSDAQTYGEKAQLISAELDHKEMQSKANQALSTLHESMLDYSKALDYHQKYANQLFNFIELSSKQQLATVQAKLEYENNEKEKELFRIKNIELAKLVEDVEKSAAILNEKNDDITSSINYASRIQKAILPNASKLQKLIPNSFLYFRPKDVVSGDFYWAGQVDNLTFIAVVDCTGQGVPAALMSIIGYNLLHNIIVYKKIYEPDKILGQLHTGIRKALKQEADKEGQNMDGMDMSLICIDHLNNELQFSGAFHSIYIVNRDNIEEIKGNTYPIGGVQDEAFRIFTNHRVSLTGSENIYLCSDGFSNQLGGEKKKRYNQKNLKSLFTDISKLDIQELEDALDKELTEYRGELEQMDDILILGVKVPSL